MAASNGRRVSYFYDAEIGNFHYGQGHPMKPHRVRMTHNLVVNYGLYRMMEVFRPKPVNAALLTRFHNDDYVNFLKIITPDNMHEYLRQLQRFNVGEDCPSSMGCSSSVNYILRVPLAARSGSTNNGAMWSSTGREVCTTPRSRKLPVFAT